MKFLRFTSAFWLLFIINPAQAQIPNPILPRNAEPLPSPQIPAEPLPQFSTPNPPAAEPLDIPGTVRVKQFIFEGNTAFSDQELAETVQRLMGRDITFAELLQAEAMITQKYTAAGFINSGAVIPAGQTFARAGATVTIQVIEGGVEAIQITGTRRLNPGYIRSRLALATRAPLNRETLLKALQLLQLDPLIEQISAELQAGTRPDLSLLNVRITEADTFQVEVSADNGRSPSVGSFRRGVSLTEANLLGLGDRLTLSYANTDGSNAYDLGYTVPINPRNGTIQVAASFTDTQVIEPPFDRIDISGDSRSYELTYRQPLIQTPSRELTVGLTAARAESETFLQNEPFPLSPGANNQGQTRVSALRFSQEYVQRSSQVVFSARSQLSLGLDLLDATVAENAPDSRFVTWRGQVQYVRLLAPDTLLVLQSDMQLTPDSLLPLEQFGIGGLNSVRGYRQDALLTDNGIFASAEVRLPILRVPQVRGVLQVVPFIDAGVGWNHTGRPSNQTSNTLLSTGVGLFWQMNDRFSARLDYGIPLIDLSENDSTWKGNDLSFTVNCAFF